MIRRTLFLFVVATSVACATSPQDANDDATTAAPTLALAFTGAQSNYNDDFDPVDNVHVYGLELSSVATREDGLGWEAGLVGGQEAGTAPGLEFDIEHAILSGGGRYTWIYDQVQTYFGGGLELAHASLEVRTLGVKTVDDTSLTGGLYVHAGVNVDIDQDGRWFTGADVRYGGIGAEHDFDDANAKPDADYTRLTFLLGLRF